ncbi:MAG TPA: STAS domain-containing protein [Pseudonocardiaceae bacterium]|jgi:rsbT antagonist protein RsbS|nr:STAS domain-containing protein [Pseudonocardiaceae bacterium]
MADLPIVELDGVLLVTVQGELLDASVAALQQELPERVIAANARGVLIDISVVDIVDSFLARALHDTAAMVALLAAQTVVVGMRPAVAITLVELGLTLPGLRTALSVRDGLALLRGDSGQVRADSR